MTKSKKHPPMSPGALFAQCGKKLCGDTTEWARSFGSILGISPTDIMQMVDGELPIPIQTWEKVSKWIVYRQRREPAELAALLTNIQRTTSIRPPQPDVPPETITVHSRKIYNAAEQMFYGREVLQHDLNQRARAAMAAAQRANNGRPPAEFRFESPSLVPSFVMLSLATELYLKCLIVLDREIERPVGHDYLLLFNMLTPETRTKVKRFYERPTSEAVKFESLMTAHTARPQHTFEESLELCRHSFEQSRYFFENHEKAPFGKHIDPGLTEAIRAAIHEMKPNWPMRVSLRRTSTIR